MALIPFFKMRNGRGVAAPASGCDMVETVLQVKEKPGFLACGIPIPYRIKPFPAPA
jgi:hypothetical protein